MEWTNPPKAVRDALETHRADEALRRRGGPDLAVSCRIFSRRACRRIIRAAFDYARKFGYQVGHDLRKAERHPRDFRHD